MDIKTQKEAYRSPEIETLNFFSEGVLCASPDGQKHDGFLGDGMYEW